MTRLSGIIRPGQSAADVVQRTHELAAWRWLTAELGDEPWSVDAVISVCERELKRPGDRLRRDWARTVIRKVAEG